MNNASETWNASWALTRLNSILRKQSYRLFGLAMFPYIAFDYMFWKRGALTNFGALGDLGGNIIFIACCYLGYKELEAKGKDE